MSGYTHARKITCEESTDKRKPVGYSWLKHYRTITNSPLSREEWMVRTDGRNMSVKRETFPTLTEARQYAKNEIRAGRTTWAEVFRLAESAVRYREIIWCSYERELIVE